SWRYEKVSAIICVEDRQIEDPIFYDFELHWARRDPQIRSGPLAQANGKVVVGFGIVSGPCATAVVAAGARRRVVDCADESVLAKRWTIWWLGRVWTPPLAEVVEVIERRLADSRKQQRRQDK